jgi:hypothetical protein
VTTLKVDWMPDGLCFLVDEKDERWAEIMQWEEDGSEEVCAALAAARAMKIVRKFNAHDELVDGLRAALNDVKLAAEIAYAHSDIGVHAELSSHAKIYAGILARAEGKETK